jgi:mRNA interferase MazF
MTDIRHWWKTRRGEVWTAAARGAYTGKPRPVVILQDDRFDATASVTVCPFTTDPLEAPLLRIPIEPSSLNGLSQPSSLMVDKLTTMPRDGLGLRLGRLADEDMVRLGRATIVFLGLA